MTAAAIRHLLLECLIGLVLGFVWAVMLVAAYLIGQARTT